MFSSLPLLIQDWLQAVNNPANPKHIRHNYYMMLSNVLEEIKKGTNQYDRDQSF